MSTKIFLIRHGESSQNIEDVLTGVTDVPLSENGKKQCAVLARYFETIHVDKVFATPLQRAQESAKLVFPKHQSIEIVESLIEFNYGHYEGYKRSEYSNNNDKVIQQWIAAPSDLTFPGGDNIRDHAKRSFIGLTDIAKMNRDSILSCISHRTTIRLIIAQIIGLSLDKFRSLPCSNCGIFEIEYDGIWNLNSLNVTLEYLKK